MAEVPPFHSAARTVVYHFDSWCTEGNNIERRNRKRGTDASRPCLRCEGLSGKRRRLRARQA